MSSKEVDRKKGFKKSIDAEEGRRRREETTLQIRKTKKDTRLAKRRQMPVGAAANTPAGMAAASMLAAGQVGGAAFPQSGAAGATPMGMDASATPAVAAGGPGANKLENLPQMVQGVMGEDAAIQTECTTQFRRLLSIEKNPPIQQVIDSGVVPRFVEFLQRDDNPALQFEAAWALTNIASGTSEHTKVVMEVGAVPIFVRLLMSPNDDVREQAVWALGNIAGDSPPCRDLVLQAGAMNPLLQQLHQNSKLSMLRNATWTLSNFCRGKPQPDFNMVKPSLPTLAQLIFSPDEEVLTDACWALSYLSDGPNEKIQAVIEAGVCRRLVELLLNPSPAVQTPALRTVGNIVTGDDLQTQFIINNNALPCLLALLSSPKKGIRKEACWTISNITAGNKDQIQAVIDNNIIPPLVQLLTNAEFDIRKEAAWAISNATSGGNGQQIKFLVQQGCVRPLCDLLTVNDAKIVTIALEGLENILKVGEEDSKAQPGTHNQMATFVAEAEGLTKIEELQQHSNNDIYEKCIKILETYFGVEDEEEMPELAPQMAEGGEQFAFAAPSAMDGQQQTFDFSSGAGAAAQHPQGP
uniref:Importin subunit alpha n=1 Tax=Odontella aurita TaxID=265563 RepID=A0A7S4M6U1_9STRA|mmetsp:Transcript_1263/g.3393  ORF Transcript_1263/g.3393 Transcript_1263/m.3393 type:complete len:581 (+) Transcript_1263:129-1871(+)|eukprot:CAMPEP_0113543640 /NCGR_PEP_ID=MMETSP0015_2-20120614/10267_1 /TAXON_ID=2838 /ORGANISM="Odontella" /LENGTH=580 /DNA_ID=CAMNT_0000443815 /DNA_START=111 /DNA_END=1853 /DNA_ORIENTATION=+ /assembly_acc=CAM_ASM_000160